MSGNASWSSQSTQVSLRRQCALLGLARGNLYSQPVSEDPENLALMRLLDEQYTATPLYGIRRMTAWLQCQGDAVNHKRVGRLLRQMGLEAIDPKPRLSQPAPDAVIYPYRWRGVSVDRINQVWSADITYVRLATGFVYLVAVIDWFSRYVLSWAVWITMDVAFCVEALEQALSQGQPEIFNTTRRSVYQSRLHGAAQERRRAGQYGWPWSGSGSRVCRVVVAQREI